MTISVTTMNASGMEATAHLTGNSLGLTALPLFPAGISLKMDVVIRSVTTLGASSTALSARRPHRPSASKCPSTFSLLLQFDIKSKTF